MGQKQYKRIIYFHNGSLGDFLMTLHLCENIHAALPTPELIIIVPRYEAVCRELAKKYPYVSVVYANRRNVLKQLTLYIFGRNCTITPPTPGRIPLATKLIARILAGFKGTMIGFNDGALVNSFLFSIMLSYDVHKLYVDTMHDIVESLGLQVSIRQLSFLYTPDPTVMERLSLQKGKYVVLHPFGSSNSRSFSVENLLWITQKLRVAFPALTILISGSDQYRESHKDVLNKFTQEKTGIFVPDALSMYELATIIKDAALYIGVDTGITHLASILGKESVAIAHTSSPPNWLPYYNANATILYHIQGDPEEVYEGREYLFANFYKVRCLEMPPIEIIYKRICEQLVKQGFHRA